MVRHPVVARIVDAYDKFEQKANQLKQEKKEKEQQLKLQEQAQAAAVLAAQSGAPQSEIGRASCRERV